MATTIAAAVAVADSFGKLHRCEDHTTLVITQTPRYPMGIRRHHDRHDPELNQATRHPALRSRSTHSRAGLAERAALRALEVSIEIIVIVILRVGSRSGWSVAFDATGINAHQKREPTYRHSPEHFFE